MFFEHLVAKSFKQFFFGIFIIASDFYLRTCPIVNFEWKKIWNGIINCTKFAFRIL